MLARRLGGLAADERLDKHLQTQFLYVDEAALCCFGR